MDQPQTLVNVSLTVPTEQLLESMADSQTFEQTIDAIMTLDEHMADMDASITVVDRLLESLRGEVAAGEGAEADLARFDTLHSELITLLKAGRDS